jgi:hypothetical protein
MSGIGKEALVDAYLARILDIKSPRLRTDGVKARVNKLAERVEAVITAYNLVAGAAVPIGAIGGTAYDTSATAVWTGVATA